MSTFETESRVFVDDCRLSEQYRRILKRDETFLLLHGKFHKAWHWKQTADHLRKAFNYRVEIPDFDVDKSGTTIHDDIGKALNMVRDHDRVVVVAHSWACELAPGIIEGLGARAVALINLNNAGPKKFLINDHEKKGRYQKGFEKAIQTDENGFNYLPEEAALQFMFNACEDKKFARRAAGLFRPQRPYEDDPDQIINLPLYLPTVQIQGQQDKVHNRLWVDDSAREWGHSAKVERLDFDHSPMVSKPQYLGMVFFARLQTMMGKDLEFSMENAVEE